MKVFNLKCVHGHAFEGWFKSHVAFEDQQAQGLLTCPFCDSNEIEKTLSAPRLNLSSAAEPQESAPPATSEPTASRQAAVMTSAPGGAPALAAALKMVREMLAQSEDVGDRFAEEARAMHANELPARPIHGQTSLETAQELAEEGIPVVAIPFGNLLKTPLQ
ncbi:MAG: hypothetical protein RJA58_557 [Pseudomonadota bacterium]|jgi:hypothetical protein